MRLHRIAELAAVVGAVGSIALTLYAGRNNNLPFLMVLISGWVLAPFMGFALAGRYSTRWAASTRAVLDCLIILVALASLVIFARAAIQPLASKPGGPFVAVPIVAWLLMFVAVPVSELIARRRQ